MFTTTNSKCYNYCKNTQLLGKNYKKIRCFLPLVYIYVFPPCSIPLLLSRSNIFANHLALT